VADTGLIYGRKAIEKHYADKFQQGQYSKHLNVADQSSPHLIGTARTPDLGFLIAPVPAFPS
jgi:hypothetical protein